MVSLTRRQALTTIGTASVGLAGCLSGTSLDGSLGHVGEAWPMDGSDPGHARRVDDGPADPREVWATELADARVAGTASVADDRLYVPVDAVSEKARHRYRLHALTAATGEERWQVPLRAEPNGSPAIRGDRVVVTARRSLERGRIVAFRNRYGGEAWLYDVDARLTAPPTVDGTTVYVPDWAGNVHALSVFDGSIRWSRRVATEESGRTFATPVAVSDGSLYLGSLSGATGVVALDAESGRERWSRSTDVVTAGPVVADGIVLVRAHSLVVAFDTDGTRRWSFNVPGEGGQTLALDDEYAYTPGGDTLYAIDRDGETAWSYESSGGRVGPPTVAGDDVVVREEGQLTALSRTDGTERWKATQTGTGEAVVTPGAVFLTGDAERVVALGDN